MSEHAAPGVGVYRMVHRVEFAETDLAGIVHFSNFFRYMERTEHAFLRSLGYSVRHRDGGVELGWPRVEASCSFRRPLWFEEEFEVTLHVRAVKSRSLSYEHVFRRLAHPYEEVARGRLTVVCVAMGAEGMRAVEIPVGLSSQLAVSSVDLAGSPDPAAAPTPGE